MKGTIRVCDNCDAPLLWTFCWAYNERYCLNCGAMGGMMGTGTDIDITPELQAQEKVISEVWTAIYKNMIPRGLYRSRKCKKCNSGQDHNEHLSKKEILNDKIATSIIEQLNKGFLNIEEDNGTTTRKNNNGLT